MGASSSKADSNGQHIFSAFVPTLLQASLSLTSTRDGPVRLSQGIVNSLETSPDVLFPQSHSPPLLIIPKTDSTRAQNIEKQVQARVADALSKIRDQEATRLDQYTASLTTDAPDPSTNTSTSDTLNDSKQAQSQSTRDRESVAQEIARLREKLDKSRRLEKPDATVDKAKSELVACLRDNQQRPLDCWEQVETFKNEVSKYEARFMEQAMR